MTLVGFGASTPELVTSVQAALSGSPGFAYGNTVGSNIANALLILGASALITPISVASGTLKRDELVMVGVGVIFALLALVIPTGTGHRPRLRARSRQLHLHRFRQESGRGQDHGAAYDKALAVQEVDSALVPAPGPGGTMVVPLRRLQLASRSWFSAAMPMGSGGLRCW